ncbi:MAG: hypothetical protein AABY22_27520 [Nanoarchaeota archaeon]
MTFNQENIQQYKNKFLFISGNDRECDEFCFSLGFKAKEELSLFIKKVDYDPGTSILSSCVVLNVYDFRDNEYCLWILTEKHFEEVIKKLT